MRKIHLISGIFAGMLAALGSGPIVYAEPPKITRTPTKKSKRGLFTDNLIPRNKILSGRRGAGICMAMQQRASKKKKNVARHRAACRA